MHFGVRYHKRKVLRWFRHLARGVPQPGQLNLLPLPSTHQLESRCWLFWSQTIFTIWYKCIHRLAHQTLIIFLSLFSETKWTKSLSAVCQKLVLNNGANPRVPPHLHTMKPLPRTPYRWTLPSCRQQHWRSVKTTLRLISSQKPLTLPLQHLPSQLREDAVRKKDSYFFFLYFFFLLSSYLKLILWYDVVLVSYNYVIIWWSSEFLVSYVLCYMLHLHLHYAATE